MRIFNWIYENIFGGRQTRIRQAALEKEEREAREKRDQEQEAAAIIRQQKHAEWKAQLSKPTTVAAVVETRTVAPQRGTLEPDLMDPLNMLSPLNMMSPLNPLSPLYYPDPEPRREDVQTSAPDPTPSSPSYDSSGSSDSGGYSSGDSGGGGYSDSGSSSSDCGSCGGGDF